MATEIAFLEIDDHDDHAHNIPMPVLSHSNDQMKERLVVKFSQKENTAGIEEQDSLNDSVMRKNAQIANAYVRIFFIVSLLVTAGLVVSAMVTLVLRLNQAYQDGISLEIVNRVRFRSEEIATDVYMIFSDPNNSTLLQYVANDLNFAGGNLSRGLSALQFGDPSVGLAVPIKNADLAEQFALLAPPENATLTAIQFIYEEVFLFNATYASVAIINELEVIIATQPALIDHLNSANTLVSQIFLNDIAAGQVEVYMFNSVILVILILEALFIFIPLERRSRRMFDVISKKNESLNRVMSNLTILTQLSPNGIFRADNKGSLKYVNARWLEITGLPADCETSQWVSCVHPDDREAVRMQHDNVLRDPNFSVSIEFRFIRPDGREIWIFCQCISEKVGGEIISLVGALTDITERKRLEQNTFNALAHAAQVQQQRAQEAEQHRLEQVRFIDIICHEIRNPLNGLVNNVDMLKQNRQDIAQILATGPSNDTKTQISPILQEEDDMWHAIELCINHQKRITDDVLHISRLQAGQFSVHERSFILGRLVDSVVSIFRAEAESSQIRLNVSYSSSCSPALRLRCDSHRTSQILINLVSNAIKFTRQRQTRTIDIEVDLQDLDETSSNNALVIFRVKDTGIGMTKEEVAKLFIPFGQANTKTFMTYGGSGMGLFLSRALLDLMKGSISVQSQPDVGSTFEFQVPCSKLSPDTPVESDENIKPDRPLSTSSIKAPSKPEQPTIANSASNPQQPYRVLVVEDNDINQKVLRRQLESVPYQLFVVTVASNGQEAVDLVAQTSFDLIVMDVEMPVLDGLEATKKIRRMEQDQSKPPVPVVGLSGNARQEHIDLAKATGMTDYLVKPCRRPELLNCIATHLHIEHQLT